MIDRRKRREVDRVIDDDVLFDGYAAAQHQSVIAARSNRIDQRVALGVPYPVGVQTLVENVERRKKPSRGYGHVLVRQVVELSILKRLVDRSGEVAGVSIAPLEISFELSSRLKNQIVVHRHE